MCFIEYIIKSSFYEVTLLKYIFLKFTTDIILAVKIRYKCTYTEIFGGEQKKKHKK